MSSAVTSAGARLPRATSSAIRWAARAIADDSHQHAVLVQLGEIIADEPAQQPHELPDFGRGTQPVFRTEGENGQDPDAELAGGAHGAPQRFDPAPMPFGARQPARSRPAAVAVHDDGNMS